VGGREACIRANGIEAGLSAVGTFLARSLRGLHDVEALGRGLAGIGGQTGLLRLTWDNGDRRAGESEFARGDPGVVIAESAKTSYLRRLRGRRSILG